MAEIAISKDKLVLGRAALLATDAVGLSPEGAFWISDSEDAAWDFFLVTSVFDRIGGRELYIRLYEVLKERLSQVEAQGLNIYILGPNEALAKEVRKLAPTREHVSDPKEIYATLGGRSAHLVVYRMADGLPQKGAHRAERFFRKLSDELVPV